LPQKVPPKLDQIWQLGRFVFGVKPLL